MKRLLAFISHWIRSKTRHGTHSPFVYALIEQCLYAPKSLDKEVRTYYKNLKSSSDSVSGMDHGSNEERTYRIADLAGRAASADREAALLAELVKYHSSKHILELGSNLGKSAAAMAKVNPEVTIIGVEGMEALAAFANQSFQKLGLSNARVVHSTFDEFFKTNKESFDFVFIDGDHRFEPTLKNYESAKALLIGEGPIVLHDIYWSNGMTKAWEKIKADEDATVTIDLFFFGLVYFRNEQRKEHFNIRWPRNLLRLLS